MENQININQNNNNQNNNQIEKIDTDIKKDINNEIEEVAVQKNGKSNSKNLNNSDIFSGSKDEYIKSLEMSVNILQNELRDIKEKYNSNQIINNSNNKDTNAFANKKNENNVDVKEIIDFPNFCECVNIESVLDIFFKFISKEFKAVELDLFVTSKNQTVSIHKDLLSSNYNILENSNGLNGLEKLTLENLYNELEERGLLEWAKNSNEIKVIQNYDENNQEAINSIIIIPIQMQNNPIAFFIANSILQPAEYNANKFPNILHIAHSAYYLIHCMRIANQANQATMEYEQLKNQTLLASNQLALSEIILTLNEEFEVPIKVIKTNFDLIEKGVGDINRRIEILTEQFQKIIASYSLMHHFGHLIEHIPVSYNFLEIVNRTIDMLDSHISKNGIILEKKFDIENEKIKGYSGQLIFAIMNIVLNSINSMPDGGKLHLGVYKNEENSKISLILTDNGNGLDNVDINGDIISLSDLSDKKIRARFHFLISQHIICQHNGKFSVYSEIGKGTTYKIILPINNN